MFRFTISNLYRLTIAVGKFISRKKRNVPFFFFKFMTLKLMQLVKIRRGYYTK